MRLKALQQQAKDLAKQRKDLAAEARTIAAIAADKRTDEQKARLVKITGDAGELAALEAQAETLEAELATEQRLVAAERELIVGDAARVEVVVDALDRHRAEVQQQMRGAALRRLSVFAAEAGFDGPAPLGSFMQAVALSGGWKGETLARDERTRLVAAAAGGAAGVPGEGGFTIRPTWSDMLLVRGREESKLLPRTTTQPIGEGSDSFEAPYLQQTDRSTASTRFGGIQVYRRAEAAEVTATKIDQFKKFELRLEDMMGLGYVTNRLLQDAVALQAWIENAFASAFAFKVDDELVRGTGSGQCLGVLNAPALVTQAKETGQAADTFVANNALNMFARLHPRNIGGAVWYVNSQLFPQLPQMHIAVGTSGFPVWLPPQGIAGAPYGTLMGRPIEPLEHCSAPGDVGDVILADYSDYLVIEKGGLQASESMHVKFVTDEMTFKFVYRMNGQPKQPAAVTPYKGSFTLSAFVTLAAR